MHYLIYKSFNLIVRLEPKCVSSSLLLYHLAVVYWKCDHIPATIWLGLACSLNALPSQMLIHVIGINGNGSMEEMCSGTS